MKFLILNADYPDFIDWLYTQNSGLESQTFEEQLYVRMANPFGTSDFYSSNLHKLGHEAKDIIINIRPLQFQWAKENDVKVRGIYRPYLRRGLVPWLYRDYPEWQYKILVEQVKKYRPDILYSMTMELIDNQFLNQVKGYYKLAIGQHAATPLQSDISAYDLVLSSLPNQVDFFRQQGLKSELFKLGFEPRILEHLTLNHKCYDISFIGGLGGIYQERTHTLEALAENFNIGVWGYGLERLDTNSSLRGCYQGSLWGKEMYQVLHSSKIVFNGHSDLVDRHFANNMRLYEATGVGSLLLTDYKPNLNEILKLNKEVIAYRNTVECTELVAHYLTHQDERIAIAKAGQQRILTDHTWYRRMQELTDIVYKYI